MTDFDELGEPIRRLLDHKARLSRNSGRPPEEHSSLFAATPARINVQDDGLLMFIDLQLGNGLSLRLQSQDTAREHEAFRALVGRLVEVSLRALDTSATEHDAPKTIPTVNTQA
ncbi:hypothetical protein [Bradyrhizobium sp. 1]|uniref:hypothetical protein n=1 Tax=Bradyrhizobium sp. 1 TaxID=241591 RepID=UPI001FF7542B|nr:hypothetical protein [Bradyrhizobium sp. 1]MCK1396135.1 hypothetical protein [Bradyrhizobium sp. 1]